MENKYEKNRLREILSKATKYGLRNGIGSPKDLRLLLEDLGPSFIKIGQILSTRPDLLPQVYTDELKNLQDNVSLGEFSLDEAELEKSLGDLSSNFKSIDRKALASASLSQVYRAVLTTGEDVIIKIQRPRAKEMVYADIKILKKLAPFINLTASKELVDMTQVVDELDLAIKKELNFLDERDNIIRFNKNNSSTKFIDAPQVYPQLCTEKILVMDYVEGIKIDQVDSLDRLGYDLDDLAKKLIYNYFQQVFDHGFFHADPHPGNILIHKKTISYIDFGLMGTLNNFMLKKLNAILESLVKKDTRELTKNIMDIGIETGEIDFNQLHRDIASIYNRYIDESIHNFDIGLILNEIIFICKENNLSMPRDLTLLSKGILTIQGVVANLSQEISLIDIAFPFFKDRFIREKFKELDSFDLAMKFYSNLDSIYNLPIKTDRVLDKLDDGDLEVNIRLVGLDRSFKKLSKMVNRLISAIIIVGILISSSLVVGQPSLRFIGSLGYSLASLLGLLLLVSIYKSRKN